MPEPASDRSGERLAAALAAVDAANADDPATVVVGGVERPKELTHAEMMTRWVRRLDPDCSDEQLIAARAHHLRRWAIPRDSYPKDRAGYLRWRTALQRQHAEDVGRIMRDAGYGDESIERVQAIVRKRGLGRDPAVQVHEDALCLVFLETQFDELTSSLDDDEKMVEILRKTAAKMSPAGLEAERQRVFRIIEELVKWDNSNNESVLEAARAEIYKATDGHPPPVLDPFCGGGSIPLEAQRLGLEAHASEPCKAGRAAALLCCRSSPGANNMVKNRLYRGLVGAVALALLAEACGLSTPGQKAVDTSSPAVQTVAPADAESEADESAPASGARVTFSDAFDGTERVVVSYLTSGAGGVNEDAPLRTYVQQIMSVIDPGGAPAP